MRFALVTQEIKIPSRGVVVFTTNRSSASAKTGGGNTVAIAVVCGGALNKNNLKLWVSRLKNVLVAICSEWGCTGRSEMCLVVVNGDWVICTVLLSQGVKP